MGSLRITNEVAGRVRLGAALWAFTWNFYSKDRTIMSEQRDTLFCGIDVAKARHVAHVLDANGKTLMRSQSFTNDAAGFALLRLRLDETRQGKPLLIGMEATGHYWYALHEYLASPPPATPDQPGYPVVVVNPLQTAMQSRKLIRKTKTDKKDAHTIATLMKNGEFRRTVIPGELATTCRQLTRLWFALGCQRTRLKQLTLSTLEWLWPEFEAHFSDPLCVAAQAVLRLAPTPQNLLAVDLPTLTKLIQTTSRRKLGQDLAQRLLDSAGTTVGMRRGGDGAAQAINTLLSQLDAAKPVRQSLKDKIEALATKIPPCLLTLPGISTLSAVSLFAETDPISTFTNPDQLVAFAGLDPSVFQTGQYDAPHRTISKRGSPHLRRTLWLMAMAAVTRPGPLADYYKRRRTAGLHHTSALTAAALKLCRITWRIMTDQRDYTPAPTAAKIDTLVIA
jgi:transposase